ncbi:hypothetical protein IV203_016559 [Nitzschia inconspicua]|uniref:Uncharacterized protein n=1 Tax=Nitzschia inconspicua TaxID=303405 RepID=A0A9K3KQ51_9STRA|nr:hypothetical protein IV203_016559 [Nitzschia inconspicua]
MVSNSFHARAFNLARRNSVRNENDLLQENFLEDDIDDDMYGVSKSSGGSIHTSEQYCYNLLKEHLPPDFQLPADCYRYSQFRAGLIRRDSKREDSHVAFVGMDPGAAIKAMSAREQGHPHEAQITRRLTSRSKDSDSSWF